jgi:hypothetical protein
VCTRLYVTSRQRFAADEFSINDAIKNPGAHSVFGKLLKFKETGSAVHKVRCPAPTTSEEVGEACSSPKGSTSLFLRPTTKFLIYTIKMNNAAQRTEEVCSSIKNTLLDTKNSK